MEVASVTEQQRQLAAHELREGIRNCRQGALVLRDRELLEHLEAAWAVLRRRAIEGRI